ncbi:hypothetical protein JTE90_008505 [Oedothorax gibbosus]|uniref:G-protein coupled receptors family 1 profile domain-containing protein n=1 Tax=Oedothorax gibbosus TaxID=931172 RepID=A0AAV6V171_9ARAC|nr:hypothetical protein JTE90_008505 [Oedothorax gibbosus]
MAYNAPYTSTTPMFLNETLMDPDEWSNTTYEFVNVSVPDITLFEFVTEGAILTLLGLLGMAGNVISLVILSRPEMRSSVNCGLQALAFFDTILLVSSITMLGLHKLGYRMMLLHRYTFEFYPYVVLIAYPVGLIAQTGSVWITVGVTVERWVAVRHPLRARFLCTHTRAKGFCLGVLIFALAYNVPRFWEIDVVKTADDVYVAKPTDFRMNKLYLEVYYIWLYLFVMYFIPFLTLAVLNVSIWNAVRRASRDRQRLTRRERKEMGLATMLVCVVAVFFVCNILALFCNVLEMLELYIPALVRVSNLLVTFNSSVNFAIYCIFGEKFRKVFLRMCLCGRFGRTKNQSFTSTLHVTQTETVRSQNVATSPQRGGKESLPNGNDTSSL